MDLITSMEEDLLEFTDPITNEVITVSKSQLNKMIDKAIDEGIRGWEEESGTIITAEIGQEIEDDITEYILTHVRLKKSSLSPVSAEDIDAIFSCTKEAST